jgi:hypothetical protein
MIIVRRDFRRRQFERRGIDVIVQFLGRPHFDRAAAARRTGFSTAVARAFFDRFVPLK